MKQTILKETEPKARKTHHCSLCHGLICPNEQYRRLTYVTDGEINDFLTCFPCQNDNVLGRVWRWTGDNSIFDQGIGFEDAAEWARETLAEECAAGLDDRGAARSWRDRFKRGQQYEQETRKENHNE